RRRHSGRDRRRRRGRGPDGRLPLPAAGTAAAQPARRPGRVPAPRPGGRDLPGELTGDAMQADFSRLRFDPAKHYSSVRQQQGRVLLDADWNEQVEIQGHRTEAEAADVIGPSGAPSHPPGTPRNFQVTANGTDFTIAAGHFYVDGILCENEADAAGSSQPPWTPGAPVVGLPTGVPKPLPAPAGTYLAYLDVWQRHVTELEDPDLHEPALGEVDTTTRTVTAWQVYLLQVPAG